MDEWGSHLPCLWEKRYAVHVSTDKEIYRPGERVQVRAVLVDSLDGTPLSILACGFTPNARMLVLSPKGEVIFTLGLVVSPFGNVHSVTQGVFEIPEEQAGGEYVVKVMLEGHPSGERKFQIRTFRNPKLHVKIDYVGSGYGPGDRVLANITVTRSEGGERLAGGKAEVTARLDGDVVYGPENADLDDAGECQVLFRLPNEIVTGVGSLTAVARDEGVVESGVKTLPIVLRALDVKFYPEGGPLVVGVENRIYFEALTPTDEPVELQGEVWAEAPGQDPFLVTYVSAEHEGRGRFRLTPEADVRYELRVVKPAGVAQPVPLPDLESVAPDDIPLVTIMATEDIYVPEQIQQWDSTETPKGLRFQLASAEATEVRVGIFKKEEELSWTVVRLPGGGLPCPVSLPLKPERVASRCGVLRATVFSDDGLPLAERIVFLRPPESLQVDVRCTTEDDAKPGADQVVEVCVRDRSGKPVKGAVVCVTATDASVVGLVEERRKAPRLPAMVYLEYEVEHLEDSNAYLENTDKGALAMDLLLGTQGWRRFAYSAPLENLQRDGEDDKRVETFERLMGVQGFLKVDVSSPSEDLRPQQGGGSGQPRNASRGTRYVQYSALITDEGRMLSISAMPNYNSHSVEELREADYSQGFRGLVSRSPAFSHSSLFGTTPVSPFGASSSLFGAQTASTIAPGAPPVAPISGGGLFGGSLFGAPAATPLFGGSATSNPQAPAFGAVTAAVFGSSPTPASVSLREPSAPMPGAPTPVSEAGAFTFRPSFGGFGSPAPDAYSSAPLFETSPPLSQALANASGASSSPPVSLGASSTSASGPSSLQATDPSNERPSAPATGTMWPESGSNTTRWEHRRIYPTRPSRITTEDSARTDFKDTVCWLPNLVTSADGIARAEFKLSDSVTSFSVLADAHAARPRQRCGAFGVSDPFLLTSRMPLYVDTKAPLELTTGDRLLLPIIVVNNTGELVRAAITAVLGSPLATTEDAAFLLRVPHRKQVRHFLPVTVLAAETGGQATRITKEGELMLPSALITITLTGNPGERQRSCHLAKLTDQVQRSVSIAPRGYPIELSYGGMLRPDSELVDEVEQPCFEFRIPSSVMEGSLEVSAVLYTTPVGNLVKALESLLVEPHGCFEQMAATVYPNILARMYFELPLSIADSATMGRSYELLATGLVRLRGYEVYGGGGFNLFGWGPAHVALTAYALLLFTDMDKVFPVPQDLLRRTKEWLLALRDHVKGTFGGDNIRPNLFSSGEFGSAPALITNAYILWSLTHAGITEGLERQVETLEEQATVTTDPYFRGLLAGALFNVGRTAQATELARSLLQSQGSNGAVTGAQTSITRSGGESLTVETTSIAILAWLNDLTLFGRAITLAIQWLHTRCKHGRFGSTQATVLALKAIVEHDRLLASPLTSFDVHLILNGALEQSLSFDPRKNLNNGTLLFDGSSLLKKLQVDTDHRLELKMERGRQKPFSFQVKYRADVPPSSAECPLKLDITLSNTTLKEGDTAEVAVSINNTSGEPLPMMIAIVGFPGGLEPRHEQLKELVLQQAIAFYEVRGREVMLYWHSMSAKAISLRLEATAVVPGVFSGPASRAYLYYTDELKSWADPLQVTINEKDCDARHSK